MRPMILPVLPRRGACVALACVALAVAGCGSGGGDGAAAQAVAKDFVTLGAHPTGQFCEILSQHILEQRTRRKGAAALAACRARVKKTGAKNHGTIPPGLRFGEAKIHGAKADVAASAPGLPTATLHLVKESGRWKVDSADG
jgi:hypothetical protein